MRTLTSSLAKLSGCFLLTASSVFASDVVLQKVPDIAPTQAAADPSKSNLGPQASFALINYNVRTKARALYVSSGTDLLQANNMIDDQAATSFGFSPQDNSPIAVIDLGKVSTVRRLSAIYSPRAGAVDFYLLQTLPGAAGENNSLKFNDRTFAKMTPIGSAIDDGTQGRASVDCPATEGRYVLLRWSPASHADTAFTVAEVSVSGPSSANLLAANRDFSNTETTEDSKDIADSKDVADSKDLPEVGAGPPGEGPPPSLPPPPPFTFIPQLVPTSP